VENSNPPGFSKRKGCKKEERNKKARGIIGCDNEET
jgi:hypothetical protein